MNVSDQRRSDAARETISRLEQIPGDYQYRALTSGFPVQRYWHRAKQRLIDTTLPVTRRDMVVDIGCGSGVVADFMASRAGSVLGIDGSAQAVAFARAQFPRPNLRFEHRLFDDLALSGAHYSAAVCMEVFEHLDQAEIMSLLHQVRHGLEAGGRLLVTTPNYRGVWPVIERLVDLSGRVPHLEGEQHITQFGPTRLRSTLERAGFETVREGTFCTFAPLVSVVGDEWADRTLQWEIGRNLSFGALLYAIARRR